MSMFSQKKGKSIPHAYISATHQLTILLLYYDFKWRKVSVIFFSKYKVYEHVLKMFCNVFIFHLLNIGLVNSIICDYNVIKTRRTVQAKVVKPGKAHVSHFAKTVKFLFLIFFILFSELIIKYTFLIMLVSHLFVFFVVVPFRLSSQLSQFLCTFLESPFQQQKQQSFRGQGKWKKKY